MRQSDKSGELYNGAPHLSTPFFYSRVKGEQLADGASLAIGSATTRMKPARPIRCGYLFELVRESTHHGRESKLASPALCLPSRTWQPGNNSL